MPEEILLYIVQIIFRIWVLNTGRGKVLGTAPYAGAASYDELRPQKEYRPRTADHLEAEQPVVTQRKTNVPAHDEALDRIGLPSLR